ncbi:unnamed protein product [Closterium sp. NIES-53]
MHSLRIAQDSTGPLSSFTTVEDLVSHLRTSDARYCATAPAEFLNRNQPPIFITLYFIVTRLPNSLRSVRDHFLSLDPTSLTVDLLEQHLLATETSAVATSLLLRRSGLLLLALCASSSKGKGGRGGGGGSSGGSGGDGTGGGGGGSGDGGGGSGGSGGSGGGGSGGGRTGARRWEWWRQDWRLQTQHRYFSRLDDAWHAEFGNEVERPRWADLLRSGVAIFDLEFDVIISAMYALSVSAEGDCYQCVPPDPGIAAAALGASESGTLPGTAPAEALHTFTLDSLVARSSTVLPCPAVPSGSLSGLHLPSFSTNLVSTAALQDSMVTTTTPGGQHVSICTCTRTGRQLATFTRRPGSSLYTLATEPSQVAASAQVPASLPPLPPSPATRCLPCVEGRQRAAPHSSSFPPTSAPRKTLHMDMWGPARVSGQGRERYFLLVVDDYTRYTTVFPLRSKGEVHDDLIPWIRAARLQLHERFGQDLPVLRLHSDRGDPPPGPAPVEVVVGSGAARGAASGGAEPGVAESESAGSGGAEPRGAEPGGAEPEGVEPGGAESEGTKSWGAEPLGAASSGGPAGASPRLSSQRLHELLVRQERPRRGATGAGGVGDAGAGGAGVTAGAGGTGAATAASPGGARTRRTGAAGAGGLGGAGAGDPPEPGVAGAGGSGAGCTGARVGGTSAGGARAGDSGAVDPGGTVRPRPYFVPLLQQVLVAAAVLAGLPLLAPSPYTEQPGSLTERREPASRLVSPARRAPHSRPPPVPGTHTMALRPSSVPLRVPLPSPPESSLPEVPDSETALDKEKYLLLPLGHEETLVAPANFEAKSLQRLHQPCIPAPWSLFEAIDGLVEPANSSAPIVIPLWLLHVDLLIYHAIEERRLHIHLLHLPATNISGC